MKVIIERGQHNGKQTIVLKEVREDGRQDSYPYSFGYMKSKKIAAALKQDPDFINRYLADCEGCI